MSQEPTNCPKVASLAAISGSGPSAGKRSKTGRALTWILLGQTGLARSDGGNGLSRRISEPRRKTRRPQPWLPAAVGWSACWPAFSCVSPHYLRNVLRQQHVECFLLLGVLKDSLWDDGKLARAVIKHIGVSVNQSPTVVDKVSAGNTRVRLAEIEVLRGDGRSSARKQALKEQQRSSLIAANPLGGGRGKADGSALQGAAPTWVPWQRSLFLMPALGEAAD